MPLMRWLRGYDFVVELVVELVPQAMWAPRRAGMEVKPEVEVTGFVVVAAAVCHW